jgi:hypothetical protein
MSNPTANSIRADYFASFSTATPMSLREAMARMAAAKDATRAAGGTWFSATEIIPDWQRMGRP